MSTTEVLSERDRVRAISALFDKHKISESTKQHYIENGCSIDQARRFVLDQIPPQSPIGSMPPLGLDARDLREFSLAKVFANPTGELKGLERECHNALFNKLPEFLRHKVKGTLVPINDLNWASRGTQNKFNFEQGGALTQSVLDGSRFIDRLRQENILMQMGVSVIENQQSDLDLPRQTSDSQIFWLNENEEIGETALNFDRVQFKYKGCGSIITYTRQMLLQSSIELENCIKNDLIFNISKAITDACLTGTGGKMPLGLFNRPELEMTPENADGDNLSLDVLTEMERIVSDANGDKGNLAYLANPTLRKKAKTTTENSSNVSQWLWQAGENRPRFGTLNGYPAAASNAVPNNFEVGNTNNANGLIFGDWSSLYLCFFGTLECMANPYGKGFQTGAISVRVLNQFDCGIRNNESFVVSKSIKS
jgi:HK97 family phage major capsid protein